MAYLKKIPAKNKQGYKWLCVMEGPPHPVTGDRRQISRRADTKNEAQALAQKAVDDLLSGIDKKKAKRTSFRSAGEEWLSDYSKSGVKNSSIRARSKALLVLYKYIDQQSIETVTFTQYQKILYKMFDDGYSEAYIRNIHIVSGMLFKWSIKNKLRADDPTREVKLPKKVLTVEEIERRNLEEKYLERNELNDFMSQVRERGLEGDEEAFKLLIYSGLRPGELCALMWPDFNASEKTLRITKTLYTPDRAGGRVEITPPKTEGSIRTISLDDVIVEMLKDLKIRQAERHKRYKKMNSDFVETNFIFTRPNGRSIDQKVLLNRMDRLIKRTSISKKATPHIFRHTHISMLTEAGVDLRTIMKRVGHDDEATTIKIYTHVTMRMKRNADENISIHFEEILNSEE
ncbi:site-specific integrase [Paenibacillus sp. DMB5]|uniref:tyrosine-type recombinase/integrase n=1 Tax=Paenibacillus sp. DMB5 TaxID=1780103 RepID=UPI00076CDF7B|nr:site-specific integrase [Paenibacillus sp. DMB5]KUP22360.1 hypothetical protein AWJ19_27460 [Paenibacillus sp. DMB5]